MIAFCFVLRRNLLEKLSHILKEFGPRKYFDYRPDEELIWFARFVAQFTLVFDKDGRFYEWGTNSSFHDIDRLYMKKDDFNRIMKDVTDRLENGVLYKPKPKPE